MKDSSQKDSLPPTQRIPPRLGKITTATNEDTTTTTTNSFFGNHDNHHFNDDNDDVHNFGTFQMDDTTTNTAFPVTNFATTTTTTNTTTTNHATFLDTSFDAAFASSTDVPFDSLFNTTSTTFTNTNNNNTMPFTTNEDDAFNMNRVSDFQGLSQSQPPSTERIIYDSTPFTNIPSLPMIQPVMVLQPKLIFEKNFHSLPIRNPANGNILFIASSSSSTTHHYSHSNPYMIYELDPNRNYIPVSSIPLLSTELHRVVASKYNATIQSIQKIWTLTMGLAQPLSLSSSSGSHRNNNTSSSSSSSSSSKLGGVREQLAAIIDLRVLEATTTMRLVVMWERNTISNQFDLYHVTTPPSGGDFASDLSTLQVSDGLLFVGGASPKGSCIFISKPKNHKYHRGGGGSSEAWSANFVTGMGSVLSMSVSMTKPYLVVALADKSITVWTYQSALRNAVVGHHESMDHPLTSGTSSSKRWLYPLCRLNYNDTLATVQPEYPGINEDDTAMDDTSDVGYCTHMAWLPAASSGSSLLLLSVTFDNALVIFHVDLPLRKDNATDKEYKPFPEPTQSTVIAATPILSPIVAKRWKGKYDHSFATWFQYGSVTDTCIAILLHDAQQPLARVLLCALHFPLKTVGPLTKREKLLTCRILSSTTIPKSDVTFPTGLLHSLDSLISYSKHTMSTITLSTTTPGSSNKISPASFLSHPVTSNPSGLSSTGEPFMSDTHMDHDGVLFIYTTVHCERETNSSDVTHLHWSLPKRRFWLCRAVAGDTMESASDEVKEETGFGESYQVLGGANVQLIYELNDAALKGLVPFRIVRGWKRNVCAVLFRCALGTTSQSISLMADCIVLVDYTGESPSISVAPGRDVAFFPGHNSNNTQGFILSLDGSSVTFFDFDPTNGLTTTSSFRPLLGVNSDSDYIDCQRILIFSDDTILNLAVLGTRSSDNRVCFVAGDVGGVAEATTKGCSNLLPNLATDRSFVFDEGEDVFAIIGLQGDGSGYRNFAMATSYRILILSSSLSVSAESVHDRACGLSPIGSFAVCYTSNNKIRYLCCLDEEMSSGVMASAGHSSRNPSPSVLIGVRPDRLILYSSMSASCLCEPAQNCDLLSLPVPSTQPVLLLEPMIANAVCIGQKKHQSTPILHLVIEKFGRKVSSIVHGENEGIGSFGAGLTPGCFAILRKYELLEAASWLLTGTIKFDKSANTRLLPPWLPIGPKSVGALNSDAMLHLLANGDSYFSDYIKSPERGIVSRLPRQTDPPALLSREYAQKQLRSGNQLDALKLLDVSGAEASENLALLVALTMDKKHNANSLSILKSLSGAMSNGTTNRSEQGKASTSLAALAELSKGSGTSDMKDGLSLKEVGSWVSMLAPSLQRSKLCSRSRQSLLRRESVETNSTKIPSDPVWNSQCNEFKHVWNEGPRKQKESLLLLDNIEDWLGRRRPLIFGKEGASAVKDRGEKTLADILNQEDDSFGGMQDDLENVKGDGWIDGVGEGRSDEANLSAYFRMSEGDDNDNSWKIDGFLDISPYQNKASVICDPLTVDLQHSTCSVDEGEVGKVKSLFDLVFTASGQGVPSGLSLPAPRGSSLDIGVLHFSDREARKKSTVEFWFFAPEVGKIFDEIVVIRRTWGSNADDMTKVAISSDRQNMLWEVLLRPTGAFEFRTCGGSLLVDSNLSNVKMPQDSSKEVTDASSLAAFGRWNHVCLVLNSKGMKLFECNATLYVKGVKALTGTTRMLPLHDDIEHWSEGPKLNEAMEKSCLLFGLNHCADFRLTELRVWSCERSAEDIQSFLYEYLSAAEQKKKFKVKITNKKNKIGTALSSQKGLFGNKKKSDDGITQTLSSGGIVFSLKPQKPSSPAARAGTGTINTVLNAELTSPVNTDATSIADLCKDVDLPNTIDQQGNTADAAENVIEDRDLDDSEDVAVTLWDSAIPLSQQLRPSAAAALIRGPPATRHYGGNRGGLPDFSGVDRVGVGGIAICGSEKTIVFRDNEDPPAVTYPIGASGAVVSDQMDDEGSEFLCCFLAKEGRMVVFELRSRTVVVELQMTTKLNFWRYLPPEAAFNSLCYMLVTPVGGFHWKPLEESPRPHQVWKRGPELQGKKVVNYEEGGSNGGGNDDICSRVGLITVTRSTGGTLLEGWILPILGDSKPKPLPTNILGACLCQPLFIDDTEPFLPILITVEKTSDGQLTVNATAMREPKDGSIFLSDVIASQVIDDYDAGGSDFVPPALAMGPLPEALCVSLSNIIVVIVRRKGLVAAFEYEENGLNIIAMECVDHFVIDAVMRYSADVGGAEIVMLLSDDKNEKDGRIVSFCFRSTD